LTIDGLGRYVKTGSALLIVGIAGGAILPKLWAILGEHVGLQKAFWIMVPCYSLSFIMLFMVTGLEKIPGIKIKNQEKVIYNCKDWIDPQSKS
jgi:fucose permease